MKNRRSFLRTILFLLTCTLLLGTVACSGGPDVSSSEEPSKSPEPSSSDNGEEPASSEESSEEPPKTLSLEEAVRALSSSLYAETLSTDKNYGLTDNGVGVDRDRFENEMLYPFPDDSEFDVIVNLADYGLASGASALQVASAMNKGMNALKAAEGKKKLVFPEGEFVLASPVSLTGMRDLYVTGSTRGTKLVYKSWSSALVLTNCENVHVSNLEFTYLTSPILVGKIQAYRPQTRSVIIAVDKAFDVTNSLYTYMYGYYEMSHDDTLGYDTIDQTKNQRYCWGDTYAVSNAAQNEVTVTFASEPRAEVVTGSTVCLAMAQYNQGQAAIIANYSTDSYFENISVSSPPAMTFVAIYSKNVYLNHYRLAPAAGQGIYLSSGADGIHTVALEGDFIVTNTLIDACQDDCLNVCSGYDVIASASGKTFTIEKETANMLSAGHTIEIYDPADMRLVGTYKVASASGTRYTVESTLDSGIKAGFLVGNVSTATHLVLDNCLFRNTYGRGGLIQCRDTVIKNCTFSNLVSCALSIHSVMDMFKEAIMPRNVRVENCKFLHINEQAIYPYVFQTTTYNYETGRTTPGSISGIHFRNNFVYSSAGNMAVFRGVSDSSVTNNLFVNFGYRYENPVGIQCQFCSDMTLRDNCIYIEGAQKNFLKTAKESCTNITEENNEYRYTRE